MRTRRLAVLASLVACTALAGCRAQQSPYSPEEALETFQLPPGFRIELVAAEPEITDPVDLAFDPDGRLYVVEMPDYPTEEGTSSTSKIRLLEDLDGDGRYETSTVFAEDLPFVNGVMPWRSGVLVTNAPDIIYFEDTDGDRRADVRRVVLTGFAATNPQLRMSNLEYGLDNWIYGAYSRAGGANRFPQFADRGTPLRFPDRSEADGAEIYPGTDFRFRPDDGVVEPAGGMSQFGNAFDAYGNRFTVWNNKHLRHVVLPHRYSTRNPYLSVGEVMATVPEHGDAATVYPITKDPLNLHESEIGHFTSACGTSIYTGEIFPGAYRGAAFVCEPVHNLVHADLMTPRGATFSSRRPLEEREFLASTDSWFRPVNTTMGPDGALYIADFYRKLVEHPTFIARADSQGLYTFAGMLQESDFYEGQDRGRIYRVVPEGYASGEAVRPTLSRASGSELVQHLAHPNHWWRITAQRLLVDRQDRAVVPALQALAREGATAEARMHALWTLDGLEVLPDELVAEALEDESPVVREQAVRLAEQRPSRPALEATLLRLAEDPNARVQFQLALALGDLPASRSFDVLQQIAFRHLEDPWFQTAVLTSASENALDWFEAARMADGATEAAARGKAQFLRRVAAVIGARQQEREVAGLLAALGEEMSVRWQVAGLEGLREGLRRGAARHIELAPGGQDALLHLVQASVPGVQEVALDVAAQVALVHSPRLRRAVQQAGETALDGQAPVVVRVHATKMLGLDPSPGALPALGQLLTPRQPPEVQLAAAEVLARKDGRDVATLLLERWDAYTSDVREVVESTFISRRERTAALLDAVERRTMEPAWLSRTSRAQLVRHPDEAIRRRAEALFGTMAEENREGIIRTYHAAAQPGGDAERGKAVFAAACSTCHQAGGVGHEVGPDLTSLTNRTRIDLMTQILDPNDNIAPGYEAYVVETLDGRTVSGVMAEESPASVVLRTAGGAEQTVLRNVIKSIRPLPVSLMPVRWEESLGVQELSDLIAYLKNLQ